MRWREREREGQSVEEENREKNYLRKAETFDKLPKNIETYTSTSERDDSLASLKKWER